MSDVYTEKHYRVYYDPAGVYIEVGPDDDGLDMVQISTRDPASRDHFGAFRLPLEKDFAIALGTALLKAARGE